MVTYKGYWNLNLFLLCLPNEIIQKIMGTLLPYPIVGSDRIIWGGTTTESFTLKSAYGRIWEGSWNPKEAVWTLIRGTLFDSDSLVSLCSLSGKIATFSRFRVFHRV
ncbi:hypothetical protein J1N35_013704 [Gossypium stocksii]|uniref:Uncharacterized protein n=1 Tax=Gossypium stocksii TaxID=47602 RepID=A0A9D4A6Y4_9ROSI|nr:hypothetical protein J1N35_013704 [Gossypium stocksii]